MNIWRLGVLFGAVALALTGCGGGGGGGSSPGGTTTTATSTTVSGSVSGAAGAGAGAAAVSSSAILTDALIAIEAHCNDPVACGQVKDDTLSSSSLTVYKPVYSGTATTNSAGAYSIHIDDPAGKLSNGGYLVVTVTANGHASSSSRIPFEGAPPTEVNVPTASLVEVTEQVQTAGTALTAADGSAVYTFGIVRYADGTRKALSGRAFASARKAAGAISELEVKIPAGSDGVTAGDTLVGRLSSFDSSNATDAQSFPGAYADTQGNRLVSLGFDYINITDGNGVNIGDKASAARAARAASGGPRKAAINWTSPTVVTRWLPTGSADNLLRDACNDTDNATDVPIADATSNCAALRKAFDDGNITVDEARLGFNIPIYTFIPSKGSWELFGIGTLMQDYAGDMLQYSEVPDSNADGKKNAADFKAYAKANQLYVRVYVTNEVFQKQYWNLDYPLVFEQPVEYCVRGSFKNDALEALSGQSVTLYDDDGETSFSRGHAYSDQDGNYRISVIRTTSSDTDTSAKVAWYNPYTYSYDNTPVTLSTSPNCATQNITVTKPQLGTVKGRVLDELGAAVADQWVWVYSTNGDYASGRSGSDGRFEFEVKRNVAYNYYLGYDYSAKGSFNVDGSAVTPEASDASNIVTLDNLILANQAPHAAGQFRSLTLQADTLGNAVARGYVWGYDYDGDWNLSWKLFDSSVAPASRKSSGVRAAVTASCSGTEINSGTFTRDDYNAELALTLATGTHNLCLQVTDSKSKSAVQQLGQIVVVAKAANRPPVLSNLYAGRYIVDTSDTNRNVTAVARAYDLDGDALSYAWYLNDVVLPDCTTATCIVSVPTAQGDYVLRAAVSDASATSERELTIRVVNRAPVIKTLSVTPLTVDQAADDTGRTVTATVTASDLDTNTTLTYTWYLDDQLLQCTGASCAVVLPAVQGAHIIRVTVDDGAGGTVSAQRTAQVGSTSLNVGVQ